MPILQFVHVVEGGDRAKMSKRRGDFVTLDELITRIGVDATRWFMLSRSHDSTIDLDLDLAAKQDPENPVYYVQMMHARIAGIFRQLSDGRVEEALAAAPGAITLNDSERELVRKVLAFPGEVAEAVDEARAAPDRHLRARARADVRGLLPRLAGARRARRRTSRTSASCFPASRSVRLRAALGLLGVSAPESM